ncbi:MAG: DNA translocase FtsK [Lachnospiraceae bacterium]|nr:DNA translocase FtsK [Lachnospiraceae bacterium]
MAAKKKTNRKKSTSQNRKSTVKNRGTKKNTSAAKAAGTNKRKQSPVRENPLTREITFLVILVFGILAFMSLFHMCGVLGEGLASILFGLLGALAYVFPLYLIVAAGLYISNPRNRSLHYKIWFSVGLYWSLCGLFQWVVNDAVINVWEIYTVCGENRGGGGFFGGLLSFELAKWLGRGGALIVILALLIVFFMLISKKLLFSSLRQLYADREERKDYVEYEDTVSGSVPERRMNTYRFEPEPKKKKEKRVEKKPEKTEPEKTEERTPSQNLDEITIIRDGSVRESEEPIYKEELKQKFGRKKTVEKSTAKLAEKAVSDSVTPLVMDSAPMDMTGMPEADGEVKKTEKVKITKEDEKEMAKVQEDLAKAAVQEIPYQFPPLDLLNQPKAGKKGMNNDELRNTALKLQETLESFGVRVKMGDISLGPSVTRYELIPEQGVKVSRITSLSDDIKLSLAASDIRIEAPIPGKAAVGIEVPNPDRTMITLRELLESNEFTKAKSKVTFAVGKDISGKTIVTDIAKMPHLLIAGATGSGKSVLINTLIMSIIYKADPNEVKLIMVDPKMVELTAYEDIPHLMIPVVKDPKKASAALGWAVAEMTGRYQKFAETGVRDIKSYNAKIGKLSKTDDPEYQKLPQIVIIVDEFADLMMVAPGEVEDSVCRLAQLARAAGIHLVLATQRPSVNVITGLIKANIPSRIALSVSSAVDSRTIIDSAGAEKLLGNGDMLFAPQNLPKPIRVQGAFVSDEERDGVVSFLKNSGSGPAYNEEVTAHIESAPVAGAQNGNATPGGDSENDELFVEAGMFIIEKDKASIGLLQRMFRIGFNRAARIMDQLADAGVVGPEEGTKARQILMTKEQFENYLEEGNG